MSVRSRSRRVRSAFPFGTNPARSFAPPYVIREAEVIPEPAQKICPTVEMIMMILNAVSPSEDWKTAISVKDMAALCDLSRQRFAQLVQEKTAIAALEPKLVIVNDNVRGRHRSYWPMLADARSIQPPARGLPRTS